jgi:hypothetical protein
MTLDDQLDALRPLTNEAVARCAGYASGNNQLTAYRASGRRLPPKRLRALAERLRELARIADEMAGT